MKALTLNGYEGLASLRIDEVATPEPGPNDVLVKVAAASVNPVDGKITKGYGGPTSQRKLPHVLGRDGAGTVAKVGSAVTGLQGRRRGLWRGRPGALGHLRGICRDAGGDHGEAARRA